VEACLGGTQKTPTTDWRNQLSADLKGQLPDPEQISELLENL
jgi:hypothetical protein